MNNVIELPEYTDVSRSVNAKEQINAQTALANLPRLAQSLFNTEGYAVVELHFGRNEEGLQQIKGRVKAVLLLVCQRCMLPMTWPVDHEFVLIPVSNDAEAKKLSDSLDPVLLSEEGTVSLKDMVEDELILQLPVVAKHVESECNVKIVTEKITSVVNINKQNSFAALAELKKT